MTRLSCYTIFLAFLVISCSSDIHWQEKLGSLLHDYGHRNWIVIADYAYPCQSSEGIETIYTGQEHLEVLDYVLEQTEYAPHVSAVIMIDRELGFLSEEDAPGIGDYRSNLENRLGKREVSTMPHEKIISRLDASSELFNVLVLKTNMVLPYTSVFIELDCGYWDAEKEKRLRDAMNTSSKDPS